MLDVVVIGAGPAGSMLARILGDRGYEVALIEQHAVPGDEVNCSGIIGVEAFQRYELPKEHILRSIDSFRFHAPGGATLDYVHPQPLAFAVNRARFDAAMSAKATAAGAVLKTRTRVDEVRVGREHVTISANRGACVLTSRFVVVATGAGSRLTEQIGLRPPRRYVLGAQVECETVPLTDRVEVHLGQEIAPSNFGWVIPLDQGRAKVGLLCEEEASFALRRFMKGPVLSDRIRHQGRMRVSLLPVDLIRRSHSNRALVVGEAAGQMKTITCGGIYYALLAAEIAADVLHEALQANASGSTALAPYETRWRGLLETELRMGLRMRSLFTRMNDKTIDKLFDVAGQDGLMDLIRSTANFDWHSDLVKAVLHHTLVQAALRPVAYRRLLF